MKKKPRVTGKQYGRLMMIHQNNRNQDNKIGTEGATLALDRTDRSLIKRELIIGNQIDGRDFWLTEAGARALDVGVKYYRPKLGDQEMAVLYEIDTYGCSIIDRPDDPLELPGNPWYRLIYLGIITPVADEYTIMFFRAGAGNE